MKRTDHTRPVLRPEALEARETPASLYTAAGAAAGGLPLVAVFRPDGSMLAQFQAFEPTFRGGVRAAVGELDGDPNTIEVAAAAGPGGGPRVEVFRVNLADGAVSTLADFFAFEASFTGGVRVAVGNLALEPGHDQLVVSADDGGGPLVRVLDVAGGAATPIPGPLGSFFAFDPGFRGGVRVAVGDLDGSVVDGDELLVAAGPGGGPRVREFRSDGQVIADFFAFQPDFLGGVQVSINQSQAVGTPRFDAQPNDPSQRDAKLNTAAGVAGTQPAVSIALPSTAAPVAVGAPIQTFPTTTQIATTNPTAVGPFVDPGMLPQQPPMPGGLATPTTGIVIPDSTEATSTGV